MEFYGTQEIQRELGVGKNKAREIIRQLNVELEKSGYLTVRGRVPRRHFERRFYPERFDKTEKGADFVWISEFIREIGWLHLLGKRDKIQEIFHAMNEWEIRFWIE